MSASIHHQAFYLVALPRGEVMRWAAIFQQELAERYNVYDKPYPPLHITVGIIYPENEQELQKAIRLLEGLFAKTAPFPVKITGASCFAPPFKSLNLSVERDAALESISNKTYEILQAHGISAQAMDDWDFHISLVNRVFARRELTGEEFQEACHVLQGVSLSLTCDIKQIQLWSPAFPPLSVIASFKLGSGE